MTISTGNRASSMQNQRVGYQDAWDLIESFPRVTFAVLDRASHFLSIE